MLTVLVGSHNVYGPFYSVHERILTNNWCIYTSCALNLYCAWPI